nr:sensor domain-containing diguanylate cyclase [Methylomarinum sp. Ch1-1]MDP4521599.1 diguanylate cyclase [Methylomarinum sp. Ch1-1]
MSSAFVVLGQSQIKQLLFNAPLLWDHLGAAGYFMLPVAMAFLFGEWCAGKFILLTQSVGVFHLAYAVGAITLSVSGHGEISNMYFIFDGLFAISLVILFGVAFVLFRKVGAEKKTIIVSYAIFSLFLLVDMAVAHSYLPWHRVPMAWGLLAFLLAITAISLHHFTVTQNALKELNATLEQLVAERTRELEYLASQDPLTDVLNRRAFHEKAEPIFRSAQRYNRDLAVIVLDIDHFKRFNDNYGHAVGDEVLVQVAACCRKVCRETDFTARFGGEEFTLLLEEASEQNALKFAERLRKTIAALQIPAIDQRITASFGISSLSTPAESLDELIIRADQALYRAKNVGRNNCQVWKTTHTFL